MATIKTQNNRRNAANDGWDVIHQETSADIVLMDDGVTTLSSRLKFQTAGGTATVITLTGVELVDGFQVSFVIAINNSGAATTINGKPLYKPGGTSAPKLVAGKAATVWYNSAGGCFFIKASAEGTAVAGDVLAGKTFSNDDDTGVTGVLSLIGTAGVGDVVNGKTFYNTDAKNVQTGTGANAKRVASGIAANASYFKITSNSAILNTQLNITGLDFTPSKVIIYFHCYWSGNPASFLKFSAINYPNAIFAGEGVTGIGVPVFTLAQGGFTLTSVGTVYFSSSYGTGPTYFVSDLVSWIAFE